MKSKRRRKSGEKNEIFRVEISDTMKHFRSKISRAFNFCAGELNLVSKCRQMNQLCCEIIKIRGKY